MPIAMGIRYRLAWVAAMSRASCRYMRTWTIEPVRAAPSRTWRAKALRSTGCLRSDRGRIGSGAVACRRRKSARSRTAAPIAAARTSLYDEIHRHRSEGEDVDDIYPTVVALAQEVFALVENGLGRYAVRDQQT